MTEEWRPIPGYEGLYEVSDQGRVRGLDRYVPREGGKAGGHPMLVRGGIRALQKKPNGGYWALALCRNSQMTNHYVHRLVLEAFVGPCPPKMEVRHLDGNPENAHLGNLAYGHPSENALDRVRHNTHNMASKTHCHRGHEFNVENTYRMKEGGRACRACRRVRRLARQVAN